MCPIASACLLTFALIRDHAFCPADLMIPGLMRWAECARKQLAWRTGYLAPGQQWEGTLGDSGRADVDIEGVSRKVSLIIEVFERRLACLDVGSRLVGLDRSLF